MLRKIEHCEHGIVLVVWKQQKHLKKYKEFIGGQVEYVSTESSGQAPFNDYFLAASDCFGQSQL